MYRFGAGEEGALAELRAAGVRPADAVPVGLADEAGERPLPERVLGRGTATAVAR